MAPDNFDTLTAKELKVIATEMKLEFAKNASAVEMRDLIRSKSETPSDTPSAPQTTPDTPPVPPEKDGKDDEDEDSSGSGDEPKPNDWVDGERPAGEYNVLANMKRNGRRYSVGDKIYFEEEDSKEVESLIADGIIF